MPKIIKNGISYGVPANLSDLYDTNITNPANGDIIQYNATAVKWENTALSGAFVPASGGTMTGALTMAGQDIILGTTDSSSDDSGDIVWKYGDGTEKMRIWSDASPTTTSGPKYRVYKSDGTSLYSGYLALGDSAGNATGCSGNSATSSMPLGFSSRGTGATWGNTTGTSFTCWNDSSGGSIDFRQNNPSSGKLSVKVDGRFYFNEGTTPAAGLKYENSYWGMTSPDGEDNVWIRTTSAGIIPYQSGGASAGHCGLGTSGWYFSAAYIQNIYGYLHGNISGSSTSCSGNASTATNASYSSYASLFSAGSTTSTTAKNFTIPTQAAEIIVTAQFASKLFCSSVPKGVLTTSNQELWVGGGRGNSLGAMNSDSARAICNVKISGTTFTLQGVASNNEGTVTTTSTTWRVYYR